MDSAIELPKWKMLEVFISHNHQDKIFVQWFGGDLAAVGVRPWINEAEINIDDWLIATISVAIDNMHYFAVVFSPRSIGEFQSEMQHWLRIRYPSAHETKIRCCDDSIFPFGSRGAGPDRADAILKVDTSGNP